MALDAPARDALTRHLAAYVGDHEAERLVSHLGVDVTEFGTRFDAIDRRFTVVDQRFDAIDRRFTEVDQRFDAIDRRFTEVDHQFELVRRDIEISAHKVVGELRGDINTAIAAQTKPLLIALVSTAALYAGAVVAIVLQLG